ncbi:hypothetical protein BXP70_15755 [Hymenobacter crusticola]|uniref:Uncharacterized protein n=1 Tax=Hymenobacter crusticola TaxID=1770526 RepID=A0A243WCA2_9BACT|nr:hypothetical protein BXP70_15755 [Hymenobacter crusticola]
MIFAFDTQAHENALLAAPDNLFGETAARTSEYFELQMSGFALLSEPGDIAVLSGNFTIR